MVIDVSGSTVHVKMVENVDPVFVGNVSTNQNVHVQMDSKDQCARHQYQQNGQQRQACQRQQQQELPHQESQHQEQLHQNKQDQQNPLDQHYQLSGDHGLLGPNVTIGLVMKFH